MSHPVSDWMQIENQERRKTKLWLVSLRSAFTLWARAHALTHTHRQTIQNGEIGDQFWAIENNLFATTSVVGICAVRSWRTSDRVYAYVSCSWQQPATASLSVALENCLISFDRFICSCVCVSVYVCFVFRGFRGLARKDETHIVHRFLHFLLSILNWRESDALCAHNGD